MKMIDTARLNSKERADAVNEVQLLASLRHPYIITYRDSFVEKNFLCIVMDYADGGDLFKAIAQQRSRGEFFSYVFNFFFNRNDVFQKLLVYNSLINTILLTPSTCY
jgi:serine/threonine protein kinase